MKIAVIQGSSQKDKNTLLYNATIKAVQNRDYEVINFGVLKDEESEYSYVEVAMMISILLESKAVDFVITGCSSGQGMMLALNSMPGVLCGYVQNPSDAYLFGRINNGNAVSIPLGLNFGWAAEINLQCVLEKLFEDEFGLGYPKEDSSRKQKDTKLLKSINKVVKSNLIEIIPKMDEDLLRKVLGKDDVYNYIITNGHNKELLEILKCYR